MSAEELERYEADMELQLYREYRDVVRMFRHVVETERRFYLANEATVTPRQAGDQVWFEVELRDAWVWDMYRPARFIPHVRVLTCRDVNIEDLPQGSEVPPFVVDSAQLPLPHPLAQPPDEPPTDPPAGPPGAAGPPPPPPSPRSR